MANHFSPTFLTKRRWFDAEKVQTLLHVDTLHTYTHSYTRSSASQWTNVTLKIFWYLFLCHLEKPCGLYSIQLLFNCLILYFSFVYISNNFVWILKMRSYLVQKSKSSKWSAKFWCHTHFSIQPQVFTAFVDKPSVVVICWCCWIFIVSKINVHLWPLCCHLVFLRNHIQST